MGGLRRNVERVTGPDHVLADRQLALRGGVLLDHSGLGLVLLRDKGGEDAAFARQASQMVGAPCAALSQTAYECWADLGLADGHYTVAPHAIQGLLRLCVCETRGLVGLH